MKTKITLIAIAMLWVLSSCKTTLHYGDAHFKANKIQYDKQAKNPNLKILYAAGSGDYLSELRREFPLDEIINEEETDQEKVLKILNWTNSRWRHNGNNSPKKNDAISILKEAREGKQFPCFAFAIVLRDQLNALGFKARTVYLKTKNARTSKYPPGHVATEVYLNDIGKWVFMDAQFNVMPTLEDKPLNAVEFQKAITQKTNGLQLLSKGKIDNGEEYYKWVYPYLFYLDTGFDQRYNQTEQHTINGKRSMMLVPTGAKELKRVNFWNLEVDYCIYTNSLLDFYAHPSL